MPTLCCMPGCHLQGYPAIWPCSSRGVPGLEALLRVCQGVAPRLRMSCDIHGWMDRHFIANISWRQGSMPSSLCPRCRGWAREPMGPSLNPAHPPQIVPPATSPCTRGSICSTATPTGTLGPSGHSTTWCGRPASTSPGDRRGAARERAGPCVCSLGPSLLRGGRWREGGCRPLAGAAFCLLVGGRGSRAAPRDPVTLVHGKRPPRLGLAPAAAAPRFLAFPPGSPTSS